MPKPERRTKKEKQLKAANESTAKARKGTRVVRNFGVDAEMALRDGRDADAVKALRDAAEAFRAEADALDAAAQEVEDAVDDPEPDPE